MGAVNLLDLRERIVEVDDIACCIEPHDWRFARDAGARIDAHWQGLVAAKPSLFDGRVLLARRLVVADGRLHGAYFETRYSRFLAWRDFGYPDLTVANGFAMAALRSADGAFMLGEMAQSTANAGKLYFPAGTPEPDDAGPDGRIDFAANILRELEEETGLAAAEVTPAETWTLVCSRRPAVAAMRVVQSSETAAQLQERLQAFNVAQAEPELARLVPVRSAGDFDSARMPDFMIAYLRAALDQAR